MKQSEVSTPIDESIIAKRAYHNCIVTVYDCDTLVELIEIYMVDFDVMMGRLVSFLLCHGILPNLIVHFHFSKETILESIDNIEVTRGKFISYLRKRR